MERNPNSDISTFRDYETIADEMKKQEQQYLHEVVITAIVRKDDGSASSPQVRYLITRRSPKKKRLPGKWTVPGGKLETRDYLELPKDTEHYWYNVQEKTLRREVKEETGIEIKKHRVPHQSCDCA